MKLQSPRWAFKLIWLPGCGDDRKTRFCGPHHGFGNTRFFELAGSLVRAAPKEKNMKRTISLWLGLLAFALLPALAQTPAPRGPTGKIHGHVTNPTGSRPDRWHREPFDRRRHTSSTPFRSTPMATYSGEAAPGTYTVDLSRRPTHLPDKMVDSFDNVKIVAGQDVAAGHRHVPQGIHRQAACRPEEAAWKSSRSTMPKP